MASIHGHFEFVRHLLTSNKCNMNIQAKEGESALIYASRYNHKDVCMYLIALGADLSLRDRLGRSALDYARDSVKHVIEQVGMCSCVYIFICLCI